MYMVFIRGQSYLCQNFSVLHNMFNDKIFTWFIDVSKFLLTTKNQKLRYYYYGNSGEKKGVAFLRDSEWV